MRELTPTTYDVVVPFLLTYVSWVLDHAKQHGIQRLYFVARDAEIMLRIAEVLQGESGSIELRYLYGSRRAWLAPSITQDDSAWKSPLVVPGEAGSRHAITTKMGLDEAIQGNLRELFSCSTAQWAAHLPPEQAIAFLDDLMGNASAAKLVLSSAAQEREAALSYFRQEGLFDDKPWALVDSGWRLNAQAALKRILDTEGVAHQTPQGYYLALGHDHLDETQAGSAYSFVPKARSIFFLHGALIEHCFLPSTHATTRGYRSEGALTFPIFSPEIRRASELNYARLLHEAAVSAARLAATDSKITAALKEHTGETLANAENLLRRPLKADAHALSSFGTVVDMCHEKSFAKPLCRPLRLKDVWTMCFPMPSRKRNFTPPTFMWLEGAIALSPWYVRAPLECLRFLGLLRNRVRESRGDSRRVSS